MGNKRPLSDDTLVVRFASDAPASELRKFSEALKSEGVRSIVLQCEEIAVLRATTATPKPIDPMEITHPDDVELLRREVRAWRAWKRGGSLTLWDQITAAIEATDKAGALG